MTWAFSDESERAATMLLGVMLVEPSAAGEARKALRTLLLPGQRRVHTAKESLRRRRQLLEVVANIEWAIDAVLWAAGPGGDWRRRIDERVRVVEIRP